MMDTNDHSEPGRVIDLGLGQMHQQVPGSPTQDLVQGQPDLSHAVHVQATADSNLATQRILCHGH